MNSATILAIETSCDETAAAVVRDGRECLGQALASQIDLHARFGGVVPEIASRSHQEVINPIIEEALERSDKSLADLDGIAVTQGPGLPGALMVGMATAKALSFGASKPLIGVNHIEGHIFASFFDHPDLSPPFISLVVSGGHTLLVYVSDWGEYEVLGETLDDAAGEAFDKISSYLGLGYPGGPIIENLAKKGDPAAINFPRAMMKTPNYNFSLSGLKTSVLYYIAKKKSAHEEINLENLAASFQEAVIDVQVSKTERAIREKNVDRLVLAGGVGANMRLRARLAEVVKTNGWRLYYPPLALCTDNAVMIGAAAWFGYNRGAFLGLDAETKPNMTLN